MSDEAAESYSEELETAFSTLVRTQTLHELARDFGGWELAAFMKKVVSKHQKRKLEDLVGYQLAGHGTIVRELTPAELGLLCTLDKHEAHVLGVGKTCIPERTGRAVCALLRADAPRALKRRWSATHVGLGSCNCCNVKEPLSSSE